MEKLKYDCGCYSLGALNIIDFEGRYRNYLSTRAPHMEWAVLSLEELVQVCKLKTDKNGVDCEIAHHVHYFLKGLPSSLSLETNTFSSLTKLKYLYFKRKLSNVLKGNVFGYYVPLVRKRLKDCGNSPTDGLQIVKQFMKVCNTLQLPVELSGEDIEQYELMAELLNFCFKIDVSDSKLIISLLKLTIDRCGVVPLHSLYVRQPPYSRGFLLYLLEHIKKERFDIGTYCLERPRTLWDYSRTFSVLNAASSGDERRVLLLLQHGFEVFPDLELRKSGHGFTYIEEILPWRYLMILQMMCNMRSVNLFLNHVNYPSNRLYSVSESQKNCFHIVWRAIPDSYVKHAEMISAIFAEYFVLAQHVILNPMRYEKNLKFCMMYERCFSGMASGPKEPRSLQHLSRCAIRKRLKENWNLPDGIFKLQVPKLLHRYLNLEYD